MREHTSTSSITMGLYPQVADRGQALMFKPLVRHPGLGRQGLRQMPVTFAAKRCEHRLALTRLKLSQVAELGTHQAALSGNDRWESCGSTHKGWALGWRAVPGAGGGPLAQRFAAAPSVGRPRQADNRV